MKIDKSRLFPNFKPENLVTMLMFLYIGKFKKKQVEEIQKPVYQYLKHANVKHFKAEIYIYSQNV